FSEAVVPETIKRRMVEQAIQERRVLTIRYRGESDRSFHQRDVEPLVQFYYEDRWSFMAFCQLRGDIRQFRLDRCRSVELTARHFTPRGGVTLESFIKNRREQLARLHPSAVTAVMAAHRAPRTHGEAAPAND